MSLDDWPPPNNSSAVASIHGVPPPERFLRQGERQKKWNFQNLGKELGQGGNCNLGPKGNRGLCCILPFCYFFILCSDHLCFLIVFKFALDHMCQVSCQVIQGKGLGQRVTEGLRVALWKLAFTRRPLSFKRLFPYLIILPLVCIAKRINSNS